MNRSFYTRIRKKQTNNIFIFLLIDNKNGQSIIKYIKTSVLKNKRN